MPISPGISVSSPGATYVLSAVWCLVAALGYRALGQVQERQRVEHELQVINPRHALETELVESA